MTKPNHRHTRGLGREAWTVRLLGAVGVAAALAATLGAAGAAPPQARLNAISALTEGRTVTVVIEASEPVPYVTAQPDPLTVVIDLRNVSAAGFRSAITKPVGPVVDVAAEDARAEDGAPLARVRLSLGQPVKPVVRSRRASILVEFGAPASDGTTTVAAANHAEPAPAAKPAPVKTEPAVKPPPAAAPAPVQAPAPKPAPAAQAAPAVQAPPAAPPTQLPAATESAPSITTVDVRASGTGTRVTVSGPVPLPGEAATSVSLIAPTKTESARLVVDFRGAVAATRTVAGPADGQVERVRIAQNSRQPLVARVVLDLRQQAPYRIERVGGQMVIVFEPVAAAPAAALAKPEAATPAVQAAPAPAPPAPAPAVVAPPVEAKAAAVQEAPAVGAPRKTEEPPAPKVEAPKPEAPKAEPPKPAAEPAKPAPSVPAAPQAAPRPQAEPVKPVVVAPSPAPTQAPPAAQAPAPAPAAPATKASSPPGPEPAAPAPPAGSVQKTYTGGPVTFDFQGADLRAVLRTFSEISGLNVVIDPSITGTVDVSLREVPWDQALEIILRANKLGYTIENNVVRIATLKALADEEQERQKLAEAQAKGGQLKVLTKPLSYAKANDLAKLLKDARIITDRGTAYVDERSNTLIINDLPEALAESESLITTLDRAERQVEIEARIVQTTRENARALGVQWGVTGRMASELGNPSGLQFPAVGSVSGRTGGVQGNPIGPVRSETPTGVNLPVTGATSALGIAMGTLNGSFNLDVALSALEKKGSGRILSTPRVVMQNNVEAEMYQGIQIPIQTVSNNTVTVTFKDAALSLKVKPQITAADTVIMDINLENASPDYSREVNGIPPIDTQRARTQVLVNDGDTTVIGGIYVQRETTANDRVPMLHRIPLLGWLFKRDSTSDDNRELLIFITPKIRK